MVCRYCGFRHGVVCHGVIRHGMAALVSSHRHRTHCRNRRNARRRERDGDQKSCQLPAHVQEDSRCLAGGHLWIVTRRPRHAASKDQ
jgi:hypothetical protein